MANNAELRKAIKKKLYERTEKSGSTEQTEFAVGRTQDTSLSDHIKATLARRMNERAEEAKRHNAIVEAYKTAMETASPGGRGRDFAVAASRMPFMDKAMESMGLDLETISDGMSQFYEMAAADEAARQAEEDKKGVEEREKLLSYDSVAGQAEIDKLSSDVARIEVLPSNISNAEKWLADYEKRNWDYRARYKRRYDKLTKNLPMLKSELDELNALYEGVSLSELQEKLRGMRVYHSNAEKYQEIYNFTRGALDAEDFAEKSGYATTKYDWDDPDDEHDILFNNEFSMGYGDLTYEYINNKNDIRNKILNEHVNDGGRAYGEHGYEYMTPEQVAVYNYYYATEGREKATEYLSLISDDLTTALARNRAMQYNDTWKEPFYNLDANIKKTGTDIFQGTKNFIMGSDDAIKYSATVKASEIARSDNKGAWKLVNDVAATTGGMLPSILVGTINPIAGAVTIGISSAGSAYNEMIKLGYSVKQARTYGTLVGASEASLSYFLSGINKLGGKATGKLATSVVTKLDNALAKVAITHPLLVSGAKTAAKIGISIGGEIAEEELQLFLEPLFKSWVTNETYLLPNFEEIAYTALVTALSTGVIEGAPTMVADAAKYSQSKQFGKSIAESGQLDALKNLGKTAPNDTTTYQLAELIDKDTNGYAIAQYFEQVGKEVSEQNVKDIVKGLERRGYTAEKANTVAGYISKALSGEELSRAQRNAIYGDDAVVDVMRSVFFNENHSVNKRNAELDRIGHKAELETANRANAKNSKSATTAHEAPASTPYNVFADSKVSAGDTFKDTKTGNTITVVRRDSDNTVVKIDTGSKTETRVVTNSQADNLVSNEQFEKIGSGKDSEYTYPITETSKEVLKTEPNRGIIEEKGTVGQTDADNISTKEAGTNEKVAVQDARGGYESIQGSDGGSSAQNGNGPRVQEGKREDTRALGEAPVSRRAQSKSAERLTDFSEEDVATSSEGSKERSVRLTLENEYGISAYIIKKSAWSRNATTYASDGTVYIREGIAVGANRDIAGHEATHVMKQLKYAPYLEFLERTPSMIDMSSAVTRNILKIMERHCEEDILYDGDENNLRVFDEFNAAMYEIGIAKGIDKSSLSDMAQVFYDFDSYISELQAIHEQFKRDNTAKGASLSHIKESETHHQIAEHENISRTDAVDTKLASQGKTATVADYAAAYGDQAQAVISTYNLGGGTQDAATFAREYELAYSWGESGAMDSYITKPNAKEATSNLTDAQRELAYSAGRDVYEAKREADVNTRQAAVDKAKAEAKARIADRQRDNAHPTTDTSKKLLKNESVSGIIEPKTNQTDEVNNYGDTRKHDNIGETQLRQNEEDGVHGRGNQKDLVGDSEHSKRTQGSDMQTDSRAAEGESPQKGLIRKVFHGTPYQFANHKKSYIDLAIHYGTEEQAGGRISGGEGHIIQADLRLDNPLVTADIFGERTPAQYVEALISESELTESQKAILKSEFEKFAALDAADMAGTSLEKKLAEGHHKIQTTVSEDGIYISLSIIDDESRINEIPLSVLLDKNQLLDILGLEETTRIFKSGSMSESAEKVLTPYLFEALLPFEVQYLQLRKIEEILQSFGYDGFAYRNDNEGSGWSYAVFDDSQVIRSENAAALSATEDVESGIRSDKTVIDSGKSRGKVHMGEGVQAVTAIQKKSLKVLDIISKALGINIYVYDSKHPRSEAEKKSDGWYDPSDNSIHIDIHSGRDGRGTMVYTAAHELTHLIKQWSPKKYKIFSDFLISQYTEHGTDVETLIAAQIDKAERHGDTISRDEALDEVIADACERMLLDSDALIKLSELANRGVEEQGLVKKLRDYMKRLMESLRKLYNTFAVNSHEAELVLKMRDVAEELYQLFEAALMDAAEASSAVGTLGGEGGAKRARKAASDTSVRNIQFNEYSIKTALWEAFDHSDGGDDNLIRVSNMPRYIVDKFGIDGDIYIYRNHAYENMVSKKRAIEDGRPIKRGKRDIHFHNLGEEKMTAALMSLNDPVMVIDETGKDGQPKIVMILDEFGNNNAPLYAAISFYENQPINGQLIRKPHLVLTVAERNYKETDGHKGYEEIIRDAVSNNKVLGYNKEKGSSLSVIAQHTRLGNITEASLNDSIARFRKNVKEFREKNKIDYSRKAIDQMSPRELLADALESVAQNDIEREKIAEYRAKRADMEAAEDRLYEVNRDIKELSFVSGKRDTAHLAELREEKRKLENNINTYDKILLRLESAKALREVVEREKKKAYARAEARGKEALAKQRERDEARFDAKLAAQREHFNEVKAAERERRHESELRGKIKSFKTKLEKMLLSPTDKQYVPENLALAMIDVCELISTDTELYKADGSINKAQAARERTKAALLALADEYKKLGTHNDSVYSAEYDEILFEYIDSVRQNLSKPLAEMDIDELSELYEALRAIGETLGDARKLIGFGDALDVYEAGDDIIAEQREIASKRKDGKRGKVGAASDSLNELGLSPVRAVERMSGYNENSFLVKLFRRLEEGERRKNKFIMDSYAVFEPLTTGDNAKNYDDAVYKPSDKTYTDKHGRGFHVTKMQMMQAVLSLEREEANGKTAHIKNDGLTFADIDMIKKGDIKKAISPQYSHAVVGDSAVKLIESFKKELSADAWAQAYMAAAREYFNGMAKDAVNEITLKLKHRIVAKDKAYIPFEVDKNFIVREITSMYDIQQTISSYGMLKETQNGASNPLIMTGLNNILDRHIGEVGAIYGLAVPVRDFNKVWNLKSPLLDTNVKESIKKNFGDGGAELIEQAIKDVQGERIDKTPAIYKKIKSNYITSVFTLNLSVVTKQVASLYSANSMLRFRDPASMLANLIYTMAHSEEIAAEVNKYTASAWMRRQGLSDSELRTLMSEGQKGFLPKLFSKAPTVISPPKWIAAMDYSVALSLWKYAKEDTALRTGLEGEALLRATAEFYDSVVENTQSMSDVLHRPEIQKRKDVISEALSMFKTDLYQMAGQIQVSLGRWNARKDSESARALGRTLYSAAMNVLWNQAMTTLFALVRYSVKRYRDDEDELTALSFLKRLGFGAVGDFMGYIVPLFGSEAVGFIESVVYGEPNDFIDNIVVSAVNDFASTAYKLGNAVVDGEMLGFDDWRKLSIKVLGTFGVPANNINRIVNAIALHAKDLYYGDFLTFKSDPNLPKSNRLYIAAIRGDDAGLDELRSTYKSDDSFHTALRKSLRENDPRVIEAAKAKADGDLEVYERIIGEIINEGRFSEADVIASVSTAYNNLTKANDAAEDGDSDEDEAVSIWSVSDIGVALDSGDTTRAKKIINELIDIKVKNGSTKKAARSSLKSALTTHYKEEYIAANNTRRREIRKAMYSTGLYDSADDVISLCNSWIKK